MEQSMKIREQGHCPLENRFRRGAHLNGPLGAPGGPWGGPQKAFSCCAEPFLAPDYRRFRAPRDLVFYKHTQNPFVYMVEANA